jgi:hypothetical protein
MIPLREIGRAVFLKSFAAPDGSLDQSDLRTRADQQTSDGLQVSDTLIALIGLRLIAR